MSVCARRRPIRYGCANLVNATRELPADVLHACCTAVWAGAACTPCAGSPQVV